jgi:uroporphyrinogen decarboxylase
MTKMIKNDIFLRACRKKSVERTPLWLMRQAGRYLPSYRAVREKAGDFLTLCKTPELAAEVTLQPINELHFDCAILFSDILLPLEAMGIPLAFEEGEGPKLEALKTEADVQRLAIPDPYESLGFVMKAVSCIKRELKNRVPLIGFGGAPFTLACYALEGGSSKDFRHILRLMYEKPEMLHALLDKTTSAMIPYLKTQVLEGADAIQLFESWGGILNPRLYRTFALPYVQRIFAALKELDVPLIFFLNGSSHLISEMALSGADVLSVDSRLPLSEASARTAGAFALQGNLEPASLFAPEEILRKEIKTVLANAPKQGHIFNLGHGILPQTPVDNVRILVETVNELTRSEL